MDVRLSDQHYFFTYDPVLFGIQANYWKNVTGTATLSSSLIRINATTVASKEQYIRGDFVIKALIPAVPTTNDDRQIGMISPVIGVAKNALYFDITDDVFTCKVVNNTGEVTTSPEITWDATWTNAQAEYKISWNSNRVEFSVGNKLVYTLSDKSLMPSKQCLSFYIANANADNVDVNHVRVENCEKVAFLIPDVA